MVTIEIAKPMQMVIVMADPRTEIVAFAATKAENCGESAAAINPQKIIKVKKKRGDKSHIQGESKQQMPDEISANCAIRLLPKRKDNLPPAKHPKAPAAMMIKARRGWDTSTAGCNSK